jgi:hypothetical protein
MTDHARLIRILSITAIVLQSLVALIHFTVYLIPVPFLHLMYGSGKLLTHTEALQHPLLFVNPLLRLTVVFLFGYLLVQESKKPNAAAPGLLMIMILLSSVVLGLLSSGISTLTNVILSRQFGVEAMASFQVLNSFTNCAGLITAPVMPMLAAAAGINYCRQRNSLS